MPFTFECERCGAEFTRNYQGKFCSKACQYATAKERRREKMRGKRSRHCASCGCAGATPREKTNPRDYSVERRLLCGKCAQAGGWPNALVDISTPVARWL